MTNKKKNFKVITNENLANRENNYEKLRQKSYSTNPLKEQFVRFTNEEAGRKFSVEDLLKW